MPETLADVHHFRARIRAGILFSLENSRLSKLTDLEVAEAARVAKFHNMDELLKQEFLKLDERFCAVHAVLTNLMLIRCDQKLTEQQREEIEKAEEIMNETRDRLIALIQD